MAAINQNTALYAILMLCAGIGIPVMAALNAELSGRLNNPALAASILFIVGALASIAYMLAFQGIPTTSIATDLPFYNYLAGLFVVFYILGITWVAPKFGIGNAVAFVLLGQLISMLTIDQFGLMGAPQTTITAQRAIGFVFMAIGVFLVVRK